LISDSDIHTKCTTTEILFGHPLSGYRVFSYVDRTLFKQLCDVHASADNRHKSFNWIIYFMQRI
jgi:hypothetical protein